MRQIVTSALVCLLALVILIPAAAFAQRNVEVANGPSKALEAYVTAQSNSDWESLLELTVEAQRAQRKAFLANDENKLQHRGYFNIIEAQLVEAKELPERFARGTADLDRYTSQYGDARVFYVGVDYRVHHEDKYHFNGVNYRIAVLVREEGAWRVAQFSGAPVEWLADSEVAFGTASERTAAEVLRARDRGWIVNATGQVLGRFGTPVREGDMSTHSCPSTIDVYLSKYENYHDWQGRSAPFTKTVNFEYYVKHVVPNEWYASWPMESLYAGALACKMYGWYWTLHDKYPDDDYDVMDTDVDQSFVGGDDGDHPRTDDAVDAMDGIGLEKASSHEIFQAQHLQGSYSNHGFHSGKMSQWGTKYWADNHKTYGYMCHYYYDYSENTDNEMMGFFSY